MTYKQNVKDGFTASICINCIATNNHVDSHTFTITQEPLNCDQSLVAIANPSKTTPYVHGGTGVTFSYTNFFTFTSIAGCIIDCSYGDTCAGTFTGTDVQITQETTPWEITASNSKIVGYSKSLCLNCISNNA